MDKKKIIIISAVVVLLIVAISLGVYFFISNKSKEIQNISIVDETYSDLQNKEEYVFEEILNEENKLYFAKSNDKAYLEVTTDGKTSRYIMRDNNTYYLDEENQVYYTYLNDQENFNMIIDKLTDLKNLSYETGTDTLENKKYYYQKYNNVDYFLFDTTKEVEDKENVSTFFYHRDGELEYIKTIENGETELLKINIEYDVDQNLFEIPKEYVQK